MEIFRISMERLNPYEMDFADGIVALSLGRKSPPGNKEIIYGMILIDS